VKAGIFPAKTGFASSWFSQTPAYPDFSYFYHRLRMKMKNFLLLAIISFSATFLYAQNAEQADKKPLIYNPSADAAKEISLAVEQAAKTGKHVFLQIGGNWCPWCLRFHKMIEDDRQLDSLVKANYEVVLVNFSRENENRKIMAELGYPHRFGFPVFVILDEKGNRIHTQDSALLEDGGKGYDRTKVISMFTMWSAEAIRKTAEKYK
jgi:thioredoxin-related protein